MASSFRSSSQILSYHSGAGAGIRSLAEPILGTTSDFAGIVFAILGIAARLERRRILERTARGRADARANGVKLKACGERRRSSYSGELSSGDAFPAARLSAMTCFKYSMPSRVKAVMASSPRPWT